MRAPLLLLIGISDGKATFRIANTLLCWYFTRWVWRFNAEVASRFANIHDSRLRGLCAAVSGHTSAHSAARVQWGAHHRRVAIVRATLLLKVQLGGQFQLLSRRARRDFVLALADVVSLAGNNFTDVGQVNDTYSADGNDVAVADAVTSARLAVYSAHDHVDALPATTSANVHPAVDTATANSVRDPSLPLQGVGTPVPCMPLRLSFLMSLIPQANSSCWRNVERLLHCNNCWRLHRASM